jgi:hypothetical protein
MEQHMPDQERDPSPDEVIAELRSREPIFHRPEHGTGRTAFEAMTVPDYWEVGASGRIYDRTTVLAELDRRYADPGYDPMEDLELRDFTCRAVGAGTWLATYNLRQGERDTRRVSVWQRVDGRWLLVYHQGTVISG